MPPAPKPDAIRRKTHHAKTTTLTPEKRPTPRAPAGLRKDTLVIWRAYWASAVSAAADVQADGFVITRWIRAVDEWQTVYEQFARARVVRGSTGQPVLNPLAAYLAQLEASIRNAEAQLGMSPVARIRLGVAIGQAKLTAAEINRLAEQAQTPLPGAAELDAAPNPEWESEWQTV